MEQWLKEIQDYKLPRWENLPELELYRDQLLTLVERYIGPVWIEDTPVVTASMVNNYVKNGLMPAPVKKRYTREHLAYLIVITFLKQVVSMDEIETGIMAQTRQAGGVELAYNTFCEKQEASIRSLNQFDQTNQTDTSSLENLLIDMVTRSFSTKLITRKILSIETSAHMEKKGK
nr:DUF1836 domain-containing protein [Companilactobacillus mishanensis]